MSTKDILQILAIIIVTASAVCGVIATGCHCNQRDTEFMIQSGYRWVPSQQAQSAHWEKSSPPSPNPLWSASLWTAKAKQQAVAARVSRGNYLQPNP